MQCKPSLIYLPIDTSVNEDALHALLFTKYLPIMHLQ